MIDTGRRRLGTVFRQQFLICCGAVETELLIKVKEVTERKQKNLLQTEIAISNKSTKRFYSNHFIEDFLEGRKRIKINNT